MTRYHETLASTSEAQEEISARCETVLNTTMAEMETYHSQKIEDFETLTKEHLDGEIQLYEQVCPVVYRVPSLIWPVCLDPVKVESGQREL